MQDLGPTTEGRPYLLAIVSAPDTIADLPRYQAMQRQLADPRVTSAAEADRIAREGKAVVLIGGSVHANEIGSSQMINDLLYSLATSDDCAGEAGARERDRAARARPRIPTGSR